MSKGVTEIVLHLAMLFLSMAEPLRKWRCRNEKSEAKKHLVVFEGNAGQLNAGTVTAH